MKSGLSGLNALRFTEIIIAPFFFFTLWLVSSREISEKFSFFFLLFSTCFFTFYSSVSGNIPASLAIISGILGWYFLRRHRIVSGAIFLAFSFYTHAGIPWIFVVSFLFLCWFLPDYRLSSFKIIILALILSSPMLFHEFIHRTYLQFNVLGETKLTDFNPAILIFGFLSLFLYLGNKKFSVVAFTGYLLGSIMVFFRYPYRFFSTQGALGLIFLASFFFDQRPAFRFRKLVFSAFIIYLVMLNPACRFENGRLRIYPLNSTFYNIVSGDSAHFPEFKSFFSSRYYPPIVEAIRKNTNDLDIIGSNLKMSATIFASLADRPASLPLLQEVKTFREISPFSFSRVIVWAKAENAGLETLKKTLHPVRIYENDFAVVFLNPFCSSRPFLFPRK